MTMIPGADTMLVVRNVLRGGRRDGFFTALGICCGLYVHGLLSALGISMILMHSATACTVLKIAGAGYLAWLGFNSLRSAARERRVADPAAIVRAAVTPARCFREGFLTNVLNPKVIAFYLALLPQFIGPADPVLLKSLLLAAIHFAEGIDWFAIVSWIVDRSRHFFMHPGMRRWLDAICGTILVGLGLRLAMQQR
ncbi:MAG: LysE family translocator [Gammaproteobacteria bacterium]|nr:LysE family translocator [Gammaproteobacteria bacterium]